MGTTKASAGNVEKDTILAAAAPQVSSNQADTAQKAIQDIIPPMGKKPRYAGDVLAELANAQSMSSASSGYKYSPDLTTKAPSSQYMAAAASPNRLSGS